MAVRLNTVPLQAVNEFRVDLVERWAQTSAVTQTRIKVGVLLVAVAGAYHYSLTSLLQTVGFDTPLAYVGLVPILALGLAWLRRRPDPRELSIHDRQLDYIIGLPLVGLAVLLAFVLPSHFETMYWVDRLDLVSLPIFVAGSVVLLFGTRVMWRQKWAILYLFLAWPWPYSSILLGSLDGFTNITLAALTRVLKVIPVAHAVPGNTGLFSVVHHGQSFPVSVVTACSGVDGMVGFFLVGAAFATIITGPIIKKILWLLAGLVLLWTTNLLRLLLIFWVGELAGEHLAINILHPVAGMVIFCIGVVLMMVLLRPFGLTMVDFGRPGAAGTATPTAPTSPGSPAPSAASAVAPKTFRPAVNKVFACGAIIVAAAFVLGVQNSTLKSFDPVASASGAPKLASFIAAPATPDGWGVNYQTQYTINKPLFGQSSLWYRYIYTQASNHTPGELGSTLPVTADIINAGGLSGFEQYGVTDCYSFHGYELRDVAKVSLGNGVIGQALSYSSSSGRTDWSIVYWILPVKMGSTTRYERVILYLQNTSGGTVTVPPGTAKVYGLKNALKTANPVDRRLQNNRNFLVAFARQIIAAQTKKTDTNISLSTVATAHGPATPAATSTGSANNGTTTRHLTPQQRAAQIAGTQKLEREGKVPNGTNGIYLPTNGGVTNGGQGQD